MFCGSASWWVLLTAALGIFRDRMSLPVLRWINRISGAVLLVFGLIAIGGGLSAAFGLA